MQTLLDDAGKMRILADKLASCRNVSRFDTEGEPEAWRLVHSLSDLERSFSEFLNNRLPALCNAQGEEEVTSALLDIGEEFRHILYHIKDPHFFRYVSSSPSPHSSEKPGSE